MASSDGGLTIQEFAKVSGLTVHTLRYYERIGLIEGVARAGSGHRRYSEDDQHWVEFLNKCRATGMSIRDMRTYAELQRRGDETLARRVEMLEALRDRVVERIAELQESLGLIRFKIRIYGQELKEQRSGGAPSSGSRGCAWPDAGLRPERTPRVRSRARAR